MASVGGYLRDLRERRAVPLGEIARTTRVAPRYLEALEADAFETLPPPVFTRGFIRAYCQALAEPPDEALARYDSREGRPAPAPPRPPALASRAEGGESRTRGAIVASFILLVVLGMALFTVALIIQPRERAERAATPSPAPVTPLPATPEPSVSRPAPPVSAAPAPAVRAPAASTPAAPGPTAPAPAVRAPAVPAPAVPAPAASAPAASAPAASAPAVAPPAAAPTPRPAPAPAPVSVTAPSVPVARPTPVAASANGLEVAAAGVASPYRLVARTSEPTWIRVRTEDGRSSEETVPAGEVREWVSDRPFVVTIGNAGGVAFELNGRALPSLGASGVVIPRLVLPPDNR